MPFEILTKILNEGFQKPLNYSKLECSLFVLQSSIDLLECDSQPSEIIKQLFSIINTLDGNLMISYTTINLIADASSQIRFFPEFSSPITEYLLKLSVNPIFSKSSSKALLSLFENASININLDILNMLYSHIQSNFDIIPSEHFSMLAEALGHRASKSISNEVK